MRRQSWVVMITVALATGVGCKCGTPVVGGPDSGPGGGPGNDGGGPGSDGGPGDAGCRLCQLDGGPNQSGQDHNFNLGGDGGTATGSGNGVQVSPTGTIVLNSSSSLFRYAWVANDFNGWVSKYDTVSEREVGRYWSVLPACDDAGVCLSFKHTNHPSRTALDLNGDVWIANRAYDPNNQIYGSVTHIISDPSRCTPRIPSRGLYTSQDLNDSGIIGDAPGEMIMPTNEMDPTLYDDCVATTTIIGSDHTAGSGQRRGRGLAVSASIENSIGDVWVAHHDEHNIYRLDSVTGQLLPANVDGGLAIHLDAGWGGYGIAVDGLQRLWVVRPTSGEIALIDATNGTLRSSSIPVKCPGCGGGGAYGIAIDGKNRVWLPGLYSGWYAYRYDLPAGADPSDAGTWTRFYFGDQTSQPGVLADGGVTYLGRPRGIAVDETGIVWMGSDEQAYQVWDAGAGGWWFLPQSRQPAGSQLIAFDSDTGQVVPFVSDAGWDAGLLDMTNYGAKLAIGVGLDSDNNVWLNNQTSGNVSKVFRSTGQFHVLAPQRCPVDDNSGVTAASNHSPGALCPGLYTYSDFTGYQLRHFTAPLGTYKQIITGCGTNTTWEGVMWQASTPPNTSIQIFVRVANDPSQFDQSGNVRYGPYSPSPVSFVNGRDPLGNPTSLLPQAPYMRVEFQLSNTDHKTSPELQGFNVQFDCFGTIN